MPSKIARSLFSGIRNVSRRKDSEIVEEGISKSAKEEKGNEHTFQEARIQNFVADKVL